MQEASSNFMELRQRMQMQTSRQQWLSKRYSEAVSNELSKKIKIGKFKHMKLQNIIADPRLNA